MSWDVYVFAPDRAAYAAYVHDEARRAAHADSFTFVEHPDIIAGRALGASNAVFLPFHDRHPDSAAILRQYQVCASRKRS